MMMNTVIMAFRYLTARKLRTTLTTLAVVFGVAIILAGNLIVPGMMDSFRRMTTTVAGGADLTFSNRVSTYFEPGRALETLRSVAGVQAATPVLSRIISVPPAAEFELVGVDPATVLAVHPYNLASGRFLQPGDHLVAVVSAPRYGDKPVALGDTWPVASAEGVQQYTVVGILNGPPSLRPQVIVPLADAQGALGQRGMASSLEVAVAPGANRDTVRAAVLKALGDSFQEGAASTSLSIGTALQMAYAIIDLLGLLTLFIGGFLIFNTFRTVILERRHDLAMLRALGAERRQVTAMILAESLVQGVLGTVVGLVVGYAMAQGVAAWVNRFGVEFLSGMQFTVGFYPTAWALAIAFGILTTLIAGYLPARAAGRVSPMAALRPALPEEERRANRTTLIVGAVLCALATLLLLAGSVTATLGALLFLVGAAVASAGLVAPVARLLSPLLTLWFAREGDVARGNLARQPGRAAITGGTLMTGLAMLIASVAMVASIQGFFGDMVRRNFSSDLLVMPQSIVLNANLGASQGLAERLRALPGVDAVASVRAGTTLANGQPATLIGIDPQTYPKVSGLVFSRGNAAEAYAALESGRQAIANAITATTLGVKPGDEVVVQTLQGAQSYRLVAIADDALNTKLSTLYVSQANLATDLGRTDDLLLMLNLKPGADLQAVRQAAQAVVADYPQFTLYVTADYRASLSALITQGMSALYLLAIIILVPAALGLLNTLTINVLERTREIGTLRAVGASRRQVQRMIIAEALLLGLFGAALGVLAGVAMSYGFVAAFSGIGWRMPYAFPLAGIIAAIVVGIFLALVAGVLPARNAAKLDIIRALQYE